MSVRVISSVFRYSKARLAARLVLVALADAAHDDGVTWVDQELIATKTLLSQSEVRRSLRELEDLGEVETRKAQRGRRRINVYRVQTVGVAAVRYSDLPFEVTVPFTTALDERSSDDGDRATGSPTTAQPARRPLKEETVSTTVNKTTEINRVYAHWRTARGKTRATYDTISAARAQKIRTRLGEFSADDLCRAIDGVASDPWKERHLHDDLTVVFRSREQVEKFLDLAATPPVSGELVDYDLAPAP